MAHSPKTLLIRCDAGARIGFGHAMRCLALGQAWRQLGGETCVLSRELPESLHHRLEAEGFTAYALQSPPGSEDDACETLRVAGELGAGWAVVDGYHFEDPWRSRLREGGVRVLAIDDYGTASCADAILNQDLLISADSYPRFNPHSPLLLGSRYTLLREEFTSRRSVPRRIRDSVHRVLITCGGSDPLNATATILRGLKGSPLEIIAVIGGSNPRRAELEQLARELSLTVRFQVDSREMAELMEWADLGITAAGSTCWEMGFMGLPALAVILADNQIPVAKAIEQLSLGLNLGWADRLAPDAIADAIEFLSTHPERLTEFSISGPRLFDGHGAERVARLLHDPPLRLRPAALDDCRKLWEWRNEPLVRQVSFSTEEIPYENHRRWFEAQLSRTDAALYVAENADGELVGQVRINFEAEKAVISISVAAEQRSRGYGTALIRLATELMLGRRKVTRIDAWIKPDNQASRYAFEKVGYAFQEQASIQDQPALRYSISLPELMLANVS